MFKLLGEDEFALGGEPQTVNPAIVNDFDLSRVSQELAAGDAPGVTGIGGEMGVLASWAAIGGLYVHVFGMGWKESEP